jgi:iron complex outermembrane recepter protein
MKNIFCFLLYFLLLAPLVQAQENIQGRVVNAENQRPLAGASISSSFSGTGTISNENGYFNLILPARADSLYVTMVGYSSLRVAVPANSSELIIRLQAISRQLSEVTVTGYETNRPLAETAGAIGLLNSREINRFNTTSLVPALNTLPGVRMDERATASYRLSIRGSSLRAPFGVRNVKLYLNDIPLVEANGTIPLNLFDAGTIGRVEVIKGPAGSTYGAGTGGTVLLQTLRPPAG